jgi:nucleoside-diphosphate-sugar epimerase
MPRILVTGGNGLTGKSLKEVSSNYPDCKFSYHDRGAGDLTESIVVQEVLIDSNPDLIILNAASLAGAHGSKAEQQTYAVKNYMIYKNFIDLANVHQKIICYSSYHVFGNSAPFSKVNVLDLNYESDYAKEKSHEIESSWTKPNVTFLIFPHLFGMYDNFKVNRAHFIANSIRRVINAKENNEREIQFFGNRKRLLQFASGTQSASFTLSLLSQMELFDQRVINANIGWVIEIGQIFDEICRLVGYNGKVFDQKTESNYSSREKDMYFKNNTILKDIPLEFTKELIQAIDYYEKEVEKV